MNIFKKKAEVKPNERRWVVTYKYQNKEGHWIETTAEAHLREGGTDGDDLWDWIKFRQRNGFNIIVLFAIEI